MALMRIISAAIPMAEINLESGLVYRKGATSVAGSQLDTLVIAAIAAALSLLHTGFVFGIQNNLFHLPIVAGLYNEPQYHDDGFIQSLPYFASGVWIVLSDTQRYFGQTELLFFVLDYLSRLLCFVGFLYCGSLLGVVDRRDKIIFGLILCATSFLEGYSYAGRGGLFVNYFTHSEIANGIVLLAIYFACKGRFTAATVALGATFFVNAFIAVWLAPLLALIGSSLLARREITFGALCSRTLVGVIPCVVLALPVLREVLANPEFGKLPSFDYAAFIREYYPDHMIFDAIAGSEIVGLVAVTSLGAAALWWFGAAARGLQAAYLGAILVYLIGIAVPHFSGAPLALNLHLLRSSTIIQLLTGLAVAALATNWLRRDKAAFFLAASLIVLALSLNGETFLLALPIILAFRLFPAIREAIPASRRSLGYPALAIVAFVVWPLSAWQTMNFNRLCADGVAEWTDVGTWARNSTPSTAMFLVPPGAPSEPAAAEIAPAQVVVFEFASHRRIWVDYKRGGAAMVIPSYYLTWRSRMNEVEQLVSLDDRLAYAARNGISYVVDPCEAEAVQQQPVFRTKRLCVFQAGGRQG